MGQVCQPLGFLALVQQQVFLPWVPTATSLPHANLRRLGQGRMLRVRHRLLPARRLQARQLNHPRVLRLVRLLIPARRLLVGRCRLASFAKG